MDPAVSAKVRINLENAVVLIIDNSMGLDILSFIFQGFGVRKLHRSRNVEDAKKLVETHLIDLIVMESLLAEGDGEGGGDGYAFVEWLRRTDLAENRFTPVVLLSAHTAASKLRKTRDCGANFLIEKPISPKVLLERILWVAREKRQFLETDTFVGPDRRFHDRDPAEETNRRRRTDTPLDALPNDAGAESGETESEP